MTSGAGAMVATAMRVVNAVPYVVAAQPGLLSAVDLPLTIPRWRLQPTRVSLNGISTSSTLLKPQAPLGPSVLSQPRYWDLSG